MTDHDHRTRQAMGTAEQQRRQAIQRLAASWPSGWTQRRADEMHDALSDQHPDDVTAACREVRATWTHLVMPPPAVLIAACEPARRARERARHEAAERAAQARGDDAKLSTGRLRVAGRRCPDGHPLIALTIDRILWCDTCRAAIQVASVPVPRVRLTHPEWQDLQLFPEDVDDLSEAA